MASDAALLNVYETALAAHVRAQEDLAKAEAAVIEARKALVAQLVPAGAKPGDHFGVYLSNDLLQIEVTHADPRITVLRNVKPPAR